MNLKKLLSHIHSKNWYRQGAAVKLLYISYPYEACSHFNIRGKLISPYYFGYIGYFKNNFMYYFFTSQSAETIGQFYLKKQTSNNNFLQNFKKYWEKHHFQKISKLSHKYEEFNFQKFPNLQLISNFQNFSRLYENAWRESIFLDAFDIFGEKAIFLAMQSSKIKINKEELQIMTSAKELTWAQKEKQELLNLIKVNNKTLEKKLQIHAQKWHWLQNDYEHIKTLTPELFKKELFRLKKQFLILKQEQQTLRHFWINTKRRKRIEKKIKKQTKTLAILNGLATLASWRDTRKTLSQMANATILKFAKEMAFRFNINLKDIEQLLYWEIAKLIKNPRKIKQLAVQRKKGILLTPYQNRQILIIPGTASKKIKDLLDNYIRKKSLTGNPAYPGKVKGIVKIILSQKDFPKMKKGDILVAPNTRPEYVPIMKIAGAIISEEGGITCHSAIVSRELKIPCIVGVQGACDVLKDGNLVEVSTDKGLVNMIKNES